MLKRLEILPGKFLKIEISDDLVEELKDLYGIDAESEIRSAAKNLFLDFQDKIYEANEEE